MTDPLALPPGAKAADIKPRFHEAVMLLRAALHEARAKRAEALDETIKLEAALTTACAGLVDWSEAAEAYSRAIERLGASPELDAHPSIAARRLDALS